MAVARKTLTALTGDVVSIAQDYSVFNKSYSTTIPSEYVTANCRVLVYVQKQYGSTRAQNVAEVTYHDFGGYYVDNCLSGKVGENIPLAFEAGSYDLYESTDYSADGTWEQLQSATAGTCYMYSEGTSVAYFPYGSDQTIFSNAVSHEAIGHGFGKLLDEYEGNGALTDAAKESYLSSFRSHGWGPNVDVTNNSESIHWAHFLKDSRYDQQIGIFEGGLTYDTGAWRPSENSMMRFNTPGFNAPSREAIYKKIMELSGDTYTLDKFLEYDAINRSSAASTVRAAQAQKIDEKHFVPLHPPVIVK